MTEDMPQYHELSIGRYTLIRWEDRPGQIEIVCNEKSEACGEGGFFPERDLEDAISKFYGENF